MLYYYSSSLYVTGFPSSRVEFQVQYHSTARFSFGKDHGGANDRYNVQGFIHRVRYLSIPLGGRKDH
jgi:hypothetical protein